MTLYVDTNTEQFVALPRRPPHAQQRQPDRGDTPTVTKDRTHYEVSAPLPLGGPWEVWALEATPADSGATLSATLVAADHHTNRPDHPEDDAGSGLTEDEATWNELCKARILRCTRTVRLPRDADVTTLDNIECTMDGARLVMRVLLEGAAVTARPTAETESGDAAASATAPATTFAAGETLVLHGLESKPSFNGIIVEVVSGPRDGRYTVRRKDNPNQRCFLVKGANLAPPRPPHDVEMAEMAAPGAENDADSWNCDSPLGSVRNGKRKSAEDAEAILSDKA